MRKPRENIEIFMKRRKKLLDRLEGKPLLVFSHPEYIRNNDVHHNYRQDSNLYYLTGFEEPESALLVCPGKTPEVVMFVRKKNPERETWDGFRYGPELTESEFKIQKVYPIEEFHQVAFELLKGYNEIYYRFYKNTDADIKVRHLLESHERAQGRTGFGMMSVHDADEFLGEMRVIKDADDLQSLRRACEISAEAHTEVMKNIKAGQSEREMHGLFIYEIMKRGSPREGYGGIFAAGANATTLHYIFNDCTLRDGDLFLVDAGAEYNYYTGDITRTYPISGKFKDEQAEVYEGVLRIQKKLIEMVKPGVKFQELHETGASMLTDLMLELGLLSGRKEDIIKAGEHKKYYPHGIGHFLGLDVHDAGMYHDKRVKEPKPIEAGMVFTIEPGIYIPLNDTNAPSQYRGIGIRIEDNILVTTNGFENLTIKAPKEINELQNLIAFKPAI
jgi:Xaa-Pro aminopeptidase